MSTRRSRRSIVLPVFLLAFAGFTGCHHYKGSYAPCEKAWLTKPVGVYSAKTEQIAQPCCSGAGLGQPVASSCNQCCGYCVWTFKPFQKWRGQSMYATSAPIVVQDGGQGQPVLSSPDAVDGWKSPGYQKMPAPPSMEVLPMPKSGQPNGSVPTKDGAKSVKPATSDKKPVEPAPMPRMPKPADPPPPPASLQAPEKVAVPPTLQPMPKAPLLEAPPQTESDKKGAPLPPTVQNADYETAPALIKAGSEIAPAPLPKVIETGVVVRVFGPTSQSKDREYVIQVMNDGDKAIRSLRMTVECPNEMKPVAVLNWSNCVVEDQLFHLAPFDLAAGSIRIIKVRVESLDKSDAKLKVQLVSPDLDAPIDAGDQKVLPVRW